MKKRTLTPEDNLSILDINLRTLEDHLSQLRSAFLSDRLENIDHKKTAKALHRDLKRFSSELQQTMRALEYQLYDGRFDG